ncbi:hypothetical protein B0H65DRAFT_587205 [Neurospora tetraspora]|uniref:Uncharacterized protein n=1 Tax=Neurospora tetraspora TaxID=94610 RepID=A0AAE0MVR7_9PEZI|nr:hypothetical protein B0H65DRAFT_587205 [Neurospora tetraspora]
MDNQGSSAEALKLVPIPQLKEDFANFDEWDHAVFFHLSYYHLTGFARDHITPPHDYDEINRLNAGLSSCGAAAIMPRKNGQPKEQQEFSISHAQKLPHAIKNL